MSLFDDDYPITVPAVTDGNNQVSIPNVPEDFAEEATNSLGITNPKNVEMAFSRVEEMVDNLKDCEAVDKRLLYVILIDHSGSTSNYIRFINEGLSWLIEYQKQQKECDVFDLCLIPFSSTAEVSINKPVCSIAQEEIPNLKPDGVTRLDLAVDKAKEVIAAYKEALRQEGIDYYRPFIIIISDGLPTNDRGQYLDITSRESLIESVQILSDGKHANCLTFYVGDDNDGISFMKKLATTPALAFNLDAKEESVQHLIQFLSNSVPTVMGAKH